MNDLILIKSGDLGDKEAMPRLNEDELGYIKDKKELYIGTKNGNIRLCGAEDAEKIAQLEEKIAQLEEKIAQPETPSE